MKTLKLLTLIFLLSVNLTFAQSKQTEILTEQNFIDTQETMVQGAVKADLVNDTKRYANIVGSAITRIGSDAKVCYSNGGIQECLSTCGIAMDGTTISTSPLALTGVGALVPAGATMIGAACDFTNGTVYLVSGKQIIGFYEEKDNIYELNFNNRLSSDDENTYAHFMKALEKIVIN